MSTASFDCAFVVQDVAMGFQARLTRQVHRVPPLQRGDQRLLDCSLFLVVAPVVSYRVIDPQVVDRHTLIEFDDIRARCPGS